MASRPIVQQQARGEKAAVAGGAKQKNMVEQGRNRKALNDIGNQISRPITRSFGAQLLAKQQPGVALDNKKKANDGAQMVPKRAAPPAQKKVNTKPKPEKEVIVISPDTEEEKKVNQKKDGGGCRLGSARRKKVTTTTSLLSARSKAACGVADGTKKPKLSVVDIDAADVNNELAVVEYVEDIYKFYKMTENEYHPHDYMGSQPDLNEKMRTILIDWLIEVHNRFELMPETLYLTINLVDRFLCLKMVSRKELQLVGIGAMLIASKYEEIWAPQVHDFVCISDSVYNEDQILKMEKTILGKLEWNLTVPTPYVFLARFNKAAIADPELENMVYFLSELALMSYPALVYLPSMVAAAAVYVARRALHKAPAWTDTLKLHTGFAESQLMECAKLLIGLHSSAAESKFQVVFRKYSKADQYAVALVSPVKSVLAFSSS